MLWAEDGLWWKSREPYTHAEDTEASVDELLATPQPLSEDNIATLRDLHEQLQCKHDLITPLDTKIPEATVEDEAIETEVLQAEETNTHINSKTKDKPLLKLYLGKRHSNPSTCTHHRQSRGP